MVIRKDKARPPAREEWFILEGHNPDEIFSEIAHRGSPSIYSNADHRVNAFGNLVGPLRNRKDIIPGRVKNLLVIDSKIYLAVFIGDTLVGKTQTAKSIVNALGGHLYERINTDGRTTYETNVMYGILRDKKVLELFTLALITHAGHDIERSIGDYEAHMGTGVQSMISKTMYCAPILTIKSSKDINAQLEKIEQLMDEWRITSKIEEIAKEGGTYHLSALFTHCNERPTNVSDDLLERLRKMGVTEFYYADNVSDEPHLTAIPEGSIRAVVETARKNLGAGLKFIYFAGGNQYIPERLEDCVVHFKDTPFRLRAAEEKDITARRSVMTGINVGKTGYEW